VIDFAKNRGLIHEEELKCAFFQQQQVTLHPIVNFYRVEGEVVRHAMIVISDDLTHDFHAVKTFMSRATAALQEVVGTDIEKRIVFSDGCSAQYKSCGPLADLSLDDGNVNRNFYGSEHGKGEGDAEIGTLNRSLDRAIVARRRGRITQIATAFDVFRYAVQNLSKTTGDSRRTYIYVKSGEIDRNRPETTVKTLAGTRAIHQAQNLPEPYSLLVRGLSCFCSPCIHETFDRCHNKGIVGAFKKVGLKPINVEIPVVNLDDSAAILNAIDFDENGEVEIRNAFKFMDSLN
jgi:hypothetical protein